MAILWLWPSHVWAQTNESRRIDESALRMISDRNIFNPNRYSRATGATRPRTDTRPASRVEYFTLVGLMEYEKGAFAFFDGTSSSYRKTVQADGLISNFKVTSLTPEQLRLVSGTNEFVMRVGMQVRREDEGDWFLTEPGQITRSRVVVSRARSRTAGDVADGQDGAMEGAFGPGLEGEPEVIILEPDTTTIPSEVNGNGEAANSTDGITDPVLLRLMQRRQELNQ